MPKKAAKTETLFIAVFSTRIMSEDGESGKAFPVRVDCKETVGEFTDRIIKEKELNANVVFVAVRSEATPPLDRSTRMHDIHPRVIHILPIGFALSGSEKPAVAKPKKGTAIAVRLTWPDGTVEQRANDRPLAMEAISEFVERVIASARLTQDDFGEVDFSVRTPSGKLVDRRRRVTSLNVQSLNVQIVRVKARRDAAKKSKAKKASKAPTITVVFNPTDRPSCTLQIPYLENDFIADVVGRARDCVYNTRTTDKPDGFDVYDEESGESIHMLSRPSDVAPSTIVVTAREKLAPIPKAGKPVLLKDAKPGDKVSLGGGLNFIVLGNVAVPVLDVKENALHWLDGDIRVERLPS